MHLCNHHLIHKDINPANILCNPKTGELKLIDFGIATRLSHQRPAFRNPGVMEGTACYISPEQTGRVNREMDYRTDFYSLGITFYELLTGSVPFDEKDTLSLVHCHIAREPVAMEQLRPEMPNAVTQIVKKLMAKNAEDRYQSAHGLESDLRHCQAWCLADKWPSEFVAGREDRPTRFEICGRLYGRDGERQTLMNAFRKVCDGACEMLLFRGYSGLGKTSLVREAYRPITESRGYFITGKFETLQQDVPYSALTQAFRSLIKQLLTEGEHALAKWRGLIGEAVGPNGQALLEVIPELALLLGPQPELPVVGPTDNRNRFTRTFLKFLRVFADKKHPLVLFLDDLQWSDAASLSFIERLMIDESPAYLFLVGAYRGDEVGSGHPLSCSREAITAAGITIAEVTLSRLNKNHIAQLLADTLVCSPEETELLASLVHTKTGGNPFFVNQFLKSLYDDGLLAFNGEEGRWQWSLSEIQARDITDNILVLMERKICALPEETRHILKMAGCLGNRFELATLAAVCQSTPAATAAGLWPSLEAGLVLPLSEHIGQTEQAHFLVESGSYKFAHDRIQEAAYVLIPEQERVALHWKVGHCLLASDNKEDRLFDAVFHLNRGQTLVSSWTQRLELAELNLTAGRRAKASAAYLPALHFLTTGLQFLELGAESRLGLDESSANGVSLPQSRYDVGLSLYEHAAEAAYLSGELEMMNSLSEQVLQQGRDLMDKIKSHEIRIQGYTSQRRYAEALQSAREVLASLGLQFPQNPTPADFNDAMEEVFACLDGRNPETLIDLPVMQNANDLAIMRILYGAWVGTLAAFPALMPLFAARQVVLSLKSGFCLESIAGFVNFGLVCCAVLGRYELGFQFDQLSRSLVERLNAPQFKPYIANIGGSCVRHWKVPLRSLFPEFRETARTALHFGDQEFSVSMMSTILVSQCSAGCNLAALDKEMAETLPLMVELKVDYAVTWTKIIWQCVHNLMGTSKQTVSLLGEAYNEDVMVPRHEATGDKNGLWLVLLHKLMLAYRFRDFPMAEKCGQELKDYPSNGSYFMPIIHFYRPLTGLAMFEDLGREEWAEKMALIEADRDLLKNWAELGPENFQHKYCLIEAERMRVLKQHDRARELYDQAIDLAIQSAYHNDASLACELAGRYYYSRGETRLASYYFNEAVALLSRWGAIALAEQLKQTFPDLLSKTTGRQSVMTEADTDSQTTSGRASSALDLASILKASQALSGEIHLERLLERLLRVVMENAGARRACLVSQHEKKWVLEAERDLSDKYGSSPLTPLEQCNTLPKTVFHAVLATAEAVLLEDAGLSDRYGRDPYLSGSEVRSVLCLPIHHQGELVAVLYLENNLYANAFTPDRLEVLQLLSSQIAISIENARLYQSLEQKVSDRTVELREALGREEQSHQDLKQAQAKLVNSEKMSSLGPLTAGIAHEINNPTCIVDTTNQNLERDLSLFRNELIEMAEGADAEIINLLEDRVKKLFTGMDRIRNGTKRIQAIVSDLRSFSRHDDSGFKPASLNGCLESTVNLVRSTFEKGAELVCHFGPDQELNCRPAQLGQVFLNILNNSYQAMGKQALENGVSGRIVIRTTQPEPGRVEIRFEDNGQGIPRAHLDKIFEPFFTTRQVGEGTGLGLTISYGIIKDHGGTIAVESVENEGTVFRISLPTIKP